MRRYPVKKIVISIGLGLLALWAMQFIYSSDFSFNPSSQTSQADSTVTDKPREGEQARAKGFRNENDWIGAYKAVQQEIRKKVENGSELTFPWNSGTEVQREGKSQSYVVKSYALLPRSKTDTTRIHFRAKVQQEEDDRWLVYELDLIDSTGVQ